MQKKGKEKVVQQQKHATACTVSFRVWFRSFGNDELLFSIVTRQSTIQQSFTRIKQDIEQFYRMIMSRRIEINIFNEQYSCC